MTKKEENATHLLRTMVDSLVDHPEQLHIAVTQVGQEFHFGITCADKDTGKLIGKQGRTARSLRTILRAAGMKSRAQFVLNIQDYAAKEEEP